MFGFLWIRLWSSNFWNRSHFSCIISPSIKLKICKLSVHTIIHEVGKNHTKYAMVSSSHVLIEFLGRSANHFVSSPIKGKGNNWRQTYYWEVFINKNRPHVSTKFFICSRESLWANPPHNLFIYQRCNIFLVTRKSTFSLSWSRCIAPTPPN